MKRIFKALYGYFLYLFVHKGDKVSFLRSRGMAIGESCEIMSTIPSFGSEPYLISIGDRCTISGNAMLITHDGSSRLYRGEIEGNRKFGNLFNKIVVEDDCFIGAGAILLPGVRVAAHSIVAAGAVVCKDVPSRSVVAGNPAKVISSLDETIQKHPLKMIVHDSVNREELRANLTKHFWGSER